MCRLPSKLLSEEEFACENSENDLGDINMNESSSDLHGWRMNDGLISMSGAVPNVCQSPAVSSVLFHINGRNG